MSLFTSSMSLFPAGAPLALAASANGPAQSLAAKIQALLPPLHFSPEEMGEPSHLLRVALEPVVQNETSFATLGLNEEQVSSLMDFIETKGVAIPAELLDALLERRSRVLKIISETWDSLTPTPTRSELVAAKLKAALVKSEGHSLTTEEITQILTDLGRVNLSRDRGPAGPMPSQVAQFSRGYTRTIELLNALDLSPEQLREHPHLVYRAAPAASDLDGTSWDTTSAWGVAPAALKHFINRTGWAWLQKKVFPFFSLLDSEFTLYTMWRVGWIEYLLGVCYALKGAYPVDTKGWSRRPAALSFHDPAVRTIFLGPDYKIEEAEAQAQRAYCGDELEKWQALEQSRQHELIIDQVERDMLAVPSFISTVHIEEVVTKLLDKFREGMKSWQNSPWTQEQLECLAHTFKRPWKDLLLPGGYNIHVGSKTPTWARAAGKLALAETLEYRGLLDDGLKHIEPLVRQGGRGIHISGGREVLLRPPKVGPIDTLLGTTYVNGRETEVIINTSEEDFDPEKGGKRVVIAGPPTLRTYEDPTGILTPLRRSIAAISTKNPTETAPVEMNLFESEVDLKHPVEQYYGVRWREEEKIINFLRHNLPQREIAWRHRLQIGLSSGLGIATANALPHLYTAYSEMQFGQHELSQFGIFMAFGVAGEAIFYRTMLGNTVGAYAGSFLMMAMALTASQMAQSLTSVTLVHNLWMGLAFSLIDHRVQRTVIPAILLAFGRRAVTHLEGQNLKLTLRATGRGRNSAKALSFTTAVAFFSILEFLIGNP